MENIWICGIGGVGGYFGGTIAHKIARSKNLEQNVFFLARGRHLEQIKKKGLELHNSDGEILFCQPTLTSDDVKDFKTPDLCFICVKSYDLDNLILTLKDLLADDTIIIPLMNGIDIYERIRKHLNKCIVLPTCVYVGSHVERPGVVIQTGNPGFFRTGPDPRHSKFDPKTILEFCSNVNIKVEWNENPYPAIWEKYLLVASFALVSAHTRETMGDIIYRDKSREILKGVMHEIIMIAKELDVKLDSNIIEKTIEFCKDYPEVIPSYARDVMKGGKNEGDLFGGTILRLGKKFNIPTPVTDSIYKA